MLVKSLNEIEMVERNSHKGFSREAVELLSHLKDEPSWMRDLRLRAWRFFEEIPMPTGKEELWRRTRLTGFRWDAFAPFPVNGNQPASGEDTPPALQKFLDTMTGAGALITQDMDVRWCELDAELATKGVLFTDLDTA